MNQLLFYSKNPVITTLLVNPLTYLEKYIWLWISCYKEKYNTFYIQQILHLAFVVRKETLCSLGYTYEEIINN